MVYRHTQCEDEDDATRMAETILRELGYTNVQKGENKFFASEVLGTVALRNIAVNAERISRWARSKLKGK